MSELADLTGRSPEELKLLIGAAAVLACAVATLRTINFFADLESAYGPSRPASRDPLKPS